ncbi:hypothetical protein ACFWD7_15605 [Streptomyces mirabilis]|uniref:hypothetical protein n=1 Tax=Streptomyces mirabilis TaxID=68239 RepID=UPI0036738009
MGRQSLYQRFERIESLLGLEIDDPDLVGPSAGAGAYTVRPAVRRWSTDGPRRYRRGHRANVTPRTPPRRCRAPGRRSSPGRSPVGCGRAPP